MGGGTLWNRDVFCSQLLLLQSTSQIVMLGSHFDKGSGVIMCDLHTTGWRHSASASRPAASRGADSRESWVYERARKGCGVTWVYACESKNSGVALAWRGVAWICQMHFGTGGEREGVRKGTSIFPDTCTSHSNAYLVFFVRARHHQPADGCAECGSKGKTQAHDAHPYPPTHGPHNGSRWAGRCLN